MLQFVRSMHLEDGWPLEQVLPWVTSNPARILKLAGKGAIAAGHDADLLLLEVGRRGSQLLGCWQLPPQLLAAGLPPPAAHVTLPPRLPGPLQPSTLALRYVVARGQVVKTPEWVRGGLFERGESGGCEIRPRTLPQAAA